MTLIATTWEIEVDLAHRDFDEDHDAGRFCERLERLGFADFEIESYLATVRRDAGAVDSDSRRTGAV